jgi:hypothetical protein
MTRHLAAKAEVLIIVLFACVPLFIHLPYRVNIFLSWEGAYRISNGQVPFRDFGIPLGGVYWLIPAVFFKVFGPRLFTLVEAQVFINIVAGVAFRSILRSLFVNKAIRLAAVLLFVLSYSFFNFWPWYNHSVIVYELVGMAFLFRYIRADIHPGPSDPGASGRYRWVWLAGAALFMLCSFLTKQDGGGIAFFLAAGILAVYGWLLGKWRPLLIFTGSYLVLLFLVVAPFLRYGFAYWFNHGQAPHSSRVYSFDIAMEFFGSSQWIKFYLFLLFLFAFIRYRSRAACRADPRGILLLTLTLGILFEAAVFQVTSYTPPDNNIFFHSFAFACILSFLVPLLPSGLSMSRLSFILMAGVLLWWSNVWWNYTQRLAGPFLSKNANISPSGENIVNRNNYVVRKDPEGDLPTEGWVECGLPSFSRITLPRPTVEGIHRLMDMDLIKKYRQGRKQGDPPGDLRVLNMSELTPLAREIPFALERNASLPLWYHLGVGMFNRQADSFETRIRNHYYDLVLFEYIPGLNNFYPFRVRDSLRLNYTQVDSFLAPRRGTETMGWIEVFVRPDTGVQTRTGFGPERKNN